MMKFFRTIFIVFILALVIAAVLAVAIAFSKLQNGG